MLVKKKPVKLRDKLKTLNEYRRWSMADLARDAKIPHRTLHNALAGRALRVDAAIAVARSMDVPTEWLFDDRAAWESLTTRPHWWPPTINWNAAATVMSDYENDLAQIVNTRHGVSTAKRSTTASPRATTGDSAAAPQTRRTRRAAGE